MLYLETVQELLEAKEGEHVQFKEAKKQFDSREAAKCCCALANNGGGKLVFGITDKRPRSVVGSAAFDQPERTRMGLIEKLKVNVDFQIFDYEGKRVLAFDVKSRPIGLPVQYDGVAWIYEGDTLKPMPEDMRRSIYEETGGDFSGTICAGATIDDLDETAIENFRTKWIEKSSKKQLATLSKEQLLHDCGAIADDGVTYAALILFGKNAAIIKYLPQAEIIFEYRSSEASGPANQREEFKVGFFACYDRVWELVNIGRKKYVLARSLYAATGKIGVHTRHVGLDRDTNKELLLKHIRQNNEVGTPFKELQQVLPGLDRNKIRVLMRELRESGKVFYEGTTSAARRFASK